MVIVGLAYLFVGLQKLRYSGSTGSRADNLRYVLWASSDAQAEPNALALFVADHDWLAHLFAATTIVVEVGFILCLPFRAPALAVRAGGDRPAPRHLGWPWASTTCRRRWPCSSSS